MLFSILGPDDGFYYNAFHDSDDSLDSIDVTEWSATEVTIYNQDTGYTTVLTGTGMVINSEGNPTAGTITGISVYAPASPDPELIGSITDISWDFVDWLDALVANAEGDPSLWVAMLQASGPLELDAQSATAGVNLSDVLAGLSGVVSTPAVVTPSDYGDVLQGGAGEDTIFVGGGFDEYAGTSGNDTVDFWGATEGARIHYAYLSGAVSFDVDLYDPEGSTATVAAGTFDDGVYSGPYAAFTDSLLDLNRAAQSGIVLIGGLGDDSFDITLTDGSFVNLLGVQGADSYTAALSADAVLRLSFAGGVAAQTATQGVVVNLSAGEIANDGFGNTETVSITGSGLVQLRGTEHDDQLTGRGGSDMMIVDGGDDTLDGAGGWDIISFTRTGHDAVSVDLDAGIATGSYNGTAFTHTLYSIEDVYGSANDDTITGSDTHNLLWGAAGQDLISAGNGSDTLEGGTGDDTLFGGDGQDLALINAASDQVVVVFRADGGIVIQSTDGDDELHDIEGISFDDTLMTMSDFLGPDVSIGTDIADILNGDNEDDTLIGAGGQDTLQGNGGDDLLGGGAGDDTLLGGTGSNTALYDGYFSDYIITGNATSATVEDIFGNDGTDSLSQIRYLRFADQTIDLTAPAYNNTPPMAEDDIAVTAYETPLTLDILANDLDFEDDALEIVWVGTPANGSVTIDDRGTADPSDDRIIYTPNAGFSGTEYLTYGVSDGFEEGLGAIEITVTEAPVTLTTGSGNSSLLGGSGADTLTAGSGDDTIDAGAGDDVITTGRPGNTGRDFGNDTVFAGAGNDSVMGSNGTDYIEGGDGDDTLDGGNDVNSADADTLWGGAGNDLLISGQGRLPTLATQDRGDEMRGGEGDDTALGGRANDLIEGGTGTDSLRGGEGNDVIYAGLEAHVLAGTVDVHGLDTIRGDYGDDTIYGADGAQELYGDGRQDWIYGGNEGESSDTDTLWGGAGNDRLFSGQTVVPTSGMGDILYGEWGYDTLVGGAADDLLVGGDENDSLEGGAGDDTLYVGVETALLGGSGGSYGIDTARGGDGDDLIVGSNGANLLVGDAGDDTISGGNDLASADTDTIRGGTGDDVLYSGQVVRPSTPAYQLRGDLLMGEEGHDTLVGGLANDTLEGGTGDDSLSGGDGDDVLYTGLESAALANTGGGFGTDTAHGGAGDDVLWGANGTQVLYGDAGNDTLHGGNDLASAEADSLFGGAGDDLLISGQVVTPTGSSAGRGDWLEGGAGDDTLVGGLAADSFVFGPDAGGGVDLVQGFEQGADVIGLQGFGAGAVVSFAQSGADVALSVDGVLVALFEDAQESAFDAADYLLL